MKFSRALFFLFFFHPIFAHALEIEWTTTIPHGELVFLETMSGQSHRPLGMKNYFSANKEYHDLKAQNIVDIFREFTNNQWSNIFIQPTSREIIDYYDEFQIRCIRATTLDELEKITKPIIKPEKQKQLFKILRDFYPIYSQLVLAPYFKKFQEKTKSLQKDHEVKTVDIVKKIQVFFDNKMDRNRKLLLGFYPVVQTGGTVMSEIHENMISIGVPVNEKDDSHRIGVIVHELTHYFFDQMPKSLVEKMNATFHQDTSIQSISASQYFNEAMATAIGNGWAMEKIKGTNEDDTWYDDTIIDRYARALYPEIKRYLENNMTIDEKFFKSAIDVFKANFPDIQNRLDSAFIRTIVISSSDIFSIQKIKPILKSYLFITDMMLATPINISANLSIFQKDPKATRLFIFNDGDKNEVKSFFQKVDFLKPFISEVDHLKKSSHVAARCNDQVPLVLISAEDIADLQKQLTQINKEEIPESKTKQKRAGNSFPALPN